MIALHEIVRECIWLKPIITHILRANGLKFPTDQPTYFYEVNDARI